MNVTSNPASSPQHPGSSRKSSRTEHRARNALKSLRAALTMVAVVVLALTGCAAIPTHGPVGKSDPLSPRNNSVNISFQQFSPADGAAPESIIRGFIESGTGINDDFQVARQYLTVGLAQSWAPDKRTLVYKNTFSVVPGADKDSYKVKFDVVSTIDAKGILTPGGTDGTTTVEMSMVKVDGQWRIDKTPDGIVLAEGPFQSLFSAVSLYFYDTTLTYGVPDVRWIAGRTSRTATSIVRALLAGPAPYLAGAVVSAFPSGMSLERDSVPVNDGVAKVGLTAQLLLDTSVRQRQQMHAQLLVTLQKALNTVTELQFLADDRQVDMGETTDSVPPMVVDNAVQSVQVALSRNELVTYDGSKIAPIPGIESVSRLIPSTPAMSYSGKDFAFLAAPGNQLFKVSTGQPAILVASGADLTPPSFGPNGWLWTAGGDGSGTVVAIDSSPKASPPVTLSVPWLVGQLVTTFRVSRDGSRALVIFHSNGVTTVAITGIAKSGDTLKALTTPISLTQTGSPSIGVWVGESSVAVAAPSASGPVSIEVLDLAKPPVTLSELTGVVWLSAGSGVRNIHAQTDDQIFTNVGNSWDVSAKALHQASFAG
ncbi:LpqB family beta-propeller domain-containing protein [Arthrobacter cryoconiti]|uniref:LpqB family beta-propeller domain-containing protein n=1 Tax=Arthrobacter cryoconiti TaxID=748907 RepID=A0ABV8QYR2_9MICC|nr:LpqB family beta-propeller domain-containing protein [Arthrobacter cryoconiti]